MKNLISMCDFVLEQWYPENLEKEEFEDVYTKIHNYAKFLKQPLELWMFMPFDKDGNIVQSPFKDNFTLVDGKWMNKGSWNQYTRELEEYQQAKERCLFKGFSVKDGLSICEENSILHIFWNYDGIWRISKGLKTIEDLSLYNLQLAPTAQKQIGV